MTSRHRVVLDQECPYMPNIPVGTLGIMTISATISVIFDGSHAQYSQFVVNGVYMGHVGQYVRDITVIDDDEDDEVWVCPICDRHNHIDSDWCEDCHLVSAPHYDDDYDDTSGDDINLLMSEWDM